MAPRATLHHVELYVPDLERAVGFWGWLLLELGADPAREWDEGCAYRLGAVEIVLVEGGREPVDRRAGGLNHLAFRVASRDEVDRLTAALRARDVRILYEDRHPFAGGPDHYAVFCEDPHGLKVELVALPAGAPSA